MILSIIAFISIVAIVYATAYLEAEMYAWDYECEYD